MALKIGDEKTQFNKTFVYVGGGKWELKPSATSTIEKQEELLTELDKKSDLTETQPVSIASLPLATGAATEAKQLADNHNVTVSNQISIATLATAAKQDLLLAELEKKADLTETQPVSVVGISFPPGGATEVKQTELNELITTLNELNARLAVLAGMANSGAPALRVIPIASVSTAVTGSVTATVASTVVSSLTNFGTGIPASEMAHDINNSTAIWANIINVAVSP